MACGFGNYFFSVNVKIRDCAFRLHPGSSSQMTRSSAARLKYLRPSCLGVCALRFFLSEGLLPFYVEFSYEKSMNCLGEYFGLRVGARP